MPSERLQITWERKPGAAYTEDVAVATMHFTSVTGTLLDNTIRAAVESAFNTAWTTAKAQVPPHVELSSYRWYDQQVWPVLSPLTRALDITNVPGTGSGTPAAPQTASSVTLETAHRKRWGRFYLPGMTAPQYHATAGRYLTAQVDSLATAMATFIQAAKTAGAVPIVWSPRGGVGPPAFAAGSSENVTGIRVDDIVDIVRRRRWQSAPYRKLIAIT